MRFFFYTKYMKELFVKHPLSDMCVALTTTTALGNLAYQVDEGNNVKEHRNLLAELLFILPNRFTYVGLGWNIQAGLNYDLDASIITFDKNNFPRRLRSYLLY